LKLKVKFIAFDHLCRLSGFSIQSESKAYCPWSPVGVEWFNINVETETAS